MADHAVILRCLETACARVLQRGPALTLSIAMLSASVVSGGLAGCSYPLVPPEAAQLATLPDGTAFVLWLQPWMIGGHERQIDNHLRRVVVSTDGHDHCVAATPPLLATDCSDSPASLGVCVPRSMTSTGVAVFELPNGDRITPAGVGVARLRADGSRVWALDGFQCQLGEDAIRGSTLLVRDCPPGAQKIDIETGAALWSLPPPSDI